MWAYFDLRIKYELKLNSAKKPVLYTNNIIPISNNANYSPQHISDAEIAGRGD